MFDDDFSSDCGFDDSTSLFDDSTACENDSFGGINPGSGLPMLDCSSIDVGGYVYGDGPDYSDL